MNETSIVVRELPRLQVIDRESLILQRCAGKRVLHLGAVDYSGREICRIHRQIGRVAGLVVGLDRDGVGINRARSVGIHDIIFADLESPGWAERVDRTPDVVVAGEILEHLANPGTLLSELGKVVGPTTESIFTTPNCLAAYRFLYPILGTERIHTEHVSYHSYSTLTALLGRFGFRTRESYAYLLPSLPPLAKLLGKLFPHFATGLVCVARGVDANSGMYPVASVGPRRASEGVGE